MSMQGMSVESIIAEYARAGFTELWKKISSDRESPLVVSAQHRSGHVIPLEITLLDLDKNESGLMLVEVKDLSDRSRLLDELASVRENFALLAETTTDGILQIDSDLQIKFANSALTKILGYDQSEMVDSSLATLFPESQYQRYEGQIRKYFIIDDEHRQDTGMRNVIELLAKKHNGDLVPVEVSMGNSRGVGNSRRLTCIIRDISLRKEADRKLRFLAYHDKLTSLGNRDRFAETLDKVLSGIGKNPDQIAALLYLDLDGFKKINDSLGHEVGDIILKSCAKRLGNCLRADDQVYRFNFEEIFRLGGDEFTILLPRIRHSEDATIVAQRVINKITQPFSVEGSASVEKIQLGVSIGIAIIPKDGNDKTILLRNADTAMYRAKELGNSFVFFAEEMSSMAMERLMLEEGLRTANARGEFELHYQPIWDRNLRVRYLEALIRWNHPDKGYLSPELFIPIAEDTGLIGPIGAWALSAAALDLRQLCSQGHEYLSVSVNLSPNQLQEGATSEAIKKTLVRAGIEPSKMILELTESTLMKSPEKSKRILEDIKGKNPGIKIAIDDFGTGYSSLAHLTQLSADLLKIDQSFIAQMNREENQKVIRTIIDLGGSLDMQVIAEGVDTEEQFLYLRDQGCIYFQGHYVAKPLALSETKEFLDKTGGERL